MLTSWPLLNIVGSPARASDVLHQAGISSVCAQMSIWRWSRPTLATSSFSKFFRLGRASFSLSAMGLFSLLSMVTKVRETTLTDVLTDELLSSGLCAVLANLSWCEILMLIL